MAAHRPARHVVLDREAGEYFLRTKAAIFPGLLLAELFGCTDGPLTREVVRNIINVNGADHGRLRKLVNPALAPRAVDALPARDARDPRELWRALAAAGRCDLVEAIARPYPARTIADGDGRAAEDAPRLHDWSMWIQRQFDPPR